METNLTSFIVFTHNPFQRGGQGEDDGQSLLQNLLYKYPQTVPDREIELLISVVISLYTFSDLSLGGKTLDFISWSNSKLSIRTQALPDDELIFFILRTPSIYSDSSVSRSLDHIKKGLFFVLGPSGITTISELTNYLQTQGETLFAKILPPKTPDPLPFSFTNLPNAEWHRAGVTSTLTELLLMRSDPKVWGVVCFVGDLLLVSHSPLDVIRLFSFVPNNSPSSIVYLTKADKLALTDHKGSIACMPDDDVFEASLLRFQHEKVIFYVLTAPNPDIQFISKIGEIPARAMSQICEVGNQSAGYENSIVYDSELNLLKCGEVSEGLRENAIYGHDLFVRDSRLRDLIMHNIKEFTVCMNVMGIEYFSSVNGSSGVSLEEMYEEALKVNPELLRFLQNLRVPSSWPSN